MSSEERKKEEEKVSPAEFQAVNQTALDALQGKFGVSLRFRSSSAAMHEVLKKIEKEASEEETTKPREFDRGFDRTKPGYDKHYDREREERESLMSERAPSEPGHEGTSPTEPSA
jgi:hypothetical protein